MNAAKTAKAIAVKTLAAAKDKFPSVSADITQAQNAFDAAVASLATATSENTAAIAAVNAAKTADAKAKQKLKSEQDKVARAA